MSEEELDKVAGNGLINRRHLLRFGASSAGLAISAGALGADQGLSFQIPTWSRQPGPGASAYGARSPFADNIERPLSKPNIPGWRLVALALTALTRHNYTE